MSVIQALGPAFAVGFAVQQDPEILDPAVEGGHAEVLEEDVLGLAAPAIGLDAAYAVKVRVLGPRGVSTLDPGIRS